MGTKIIHGNCACGRLSTAIAQYEDGTVEPVCELCFEAKKKWAADQEPTIKIEGRIPRELHDKIRELALEQHGKGEDDPMDKAVEIVVRAGLDILSSKRCQCPAGSVCEFFEQDNCLYGDI